MNDVTKDDGFNLNPDGRLIRGDLIKCKDGRWNWEGEFLVVGKVEALQRWQDKTPVETILTKPLPDPDELNAAVPQSTWEAGLNGPRPPWQYQVVLYLLSPKDGSMCTFASGTIGARIAVDRLADRITTMRLMRGENVVPLVKLGNAPMKTKFGERLRPEFEIVGWRFFGPQTEQKKIAGITPVDPPTLTEELNDSIGF